jgi:hypothetical protein
MKEVEYIVASEAVKKVVWIKNFVSELVVVVHSVSSPTDLYRDNSEAIAQEKDPRSHKKSKHVRRHYHLICEIIN